ncbi:MAG: IgGFc-binding protein, partial [Myxococcota bacterium]
MNATQPALTRPAWTWPLVMLAATLVLPSACKSDPPGGTGSMSGSDPTQGESESDDAEGPQFECMPGEVRCSGQAFLETCAPTGLEWVSEPCDLNEFCAPCGQDGTCAQDRCVGPCEIEAGLPSSAGCSFIVNRQLHLEETEPDGLVVTNPNDDLAAAVQFYRTPEGKRKEEAVGSPRILEPGESTLFELDASFVLGNSSMFRTGGTYRVESDVPVIAYQHSPLVTFTGNDSSMLLPETTLRRDYVVYSFSPHAAQVDGKGEPSYFEIVALEDFTEVEWTPPVDTAGTGVNIDFVPAGQTSPVLNMNRFDTVRIAASANFQENSFLRDVSGTVIHANKPIAVVGASRCSRVPVRTEEGMEQGFCDPLQEMLIPLDYWGERYVAAHPPIRNQERHFWRIYSGSNNVKVVATGNIACTEDIITAENCEAPNEFDGEGCILEKRGSWIQVDVENRCSFFLNSNNTGPFMPVGYLQSSRQIGEPTSEATDAGDP